MSATQYNPGDTVGIYTIVKRSTENNLKLQRDETDALKRGYCAKHNIKLFELRFDKDLSRQLNEVLEYYRKNL